MQTKSCVIPLYFQLFISFCFLSISYIPAQEITVSDIRVGHVGHDHHMALFWAADCGKNLSEKTGCYWLDKVSDRHIYNLRKNNDIIARIELIKVGGGSGMPMAVSAGQIDLGFGGMAPVALAVERGAQMKIVAPANADGDFLLMDKKFNLNSWSDFVALAKRSQQPLRIGYKAPKAVAFLTLVAGLKSVGLKYATQPVDAGGDEVQVQLVNLQKASSIVPSLQSGVVDGVVINQPLAALAEYRKLGRIVCPLSDVLPKDLWKTRPCCCVAASDKVLVEHKDIVRVLLNIFRVATNDMNEKMKGVGLEEVARTAARWTGVPQEVELRSVSSNVFVADADLDWRNGCRQWFGVMKGLGQFSGRFAALEPEAIEQAVSDYFFTQR